MLALGTERIGDLAVVECKGRIVRSEDAFRLRDTVMSLGDSRIIVLDLSDVSAIEGGGLGMLQFLHRWAYDHEIQLKLFSPARSVQERLQRATSVRGLKLLFVVDDTSPWLPEAGLTDRFEPAPNEWRQHSGRRFLECSHGLETLNPLCR